MKSPPLWVASEDNTQGNLKKVPDSKFDMSRYSDSSGRIVISESQMLGVIEEFYKREESKVTVIPSEFNPWYERVRKRESTRPHEQFLSNQIKTYEQMRLIGQLGREIR